MNILVTGGAGFIGSHIVDALIEKGHNVSVIDDLSLGEEKNINASVKFYEGDINNLDVLEMIFRQEQPEVVFHLAANAREGASQFIPIKVSQTNYEGYIRVLTTAIKNKVKKIILFSSMAVYGEQLTPFFETMEPKPVDIYGVNKTAMERATQILAKVHGFDWVIVRPHNVFGERQSLRDPYRNVMGIFMNRIMRGEPLYIYGDGEQKRAFSYIDDSIPCYLKLLETRNEIFNIGGIKKITINELAQLVIKEFGLSDYPIIHLDDRPCEVKNAWCTFFKSVEHLDYSDKTSLKEGIHKMAEWAKQEGPQEWIEEKLEIYSRSTPETWR